MNSVTCRRLLALVSGCAICFSLNAQTSREYLQTGVVTRTGNQVAISANAPRALAQALCALSRTNEWLVDYEDPPYMSSSELRDVTNREWLAKNPQARHAFIPAGGAFTFEYEAGASEESILHDMVAAYNRTDNPGRFEVRDEGEDSRPWSKTHKRYAIVGSGLRDESGRTAGVNPILDTLISLPLQERSVYELF